MTKGDTPRTTWVGNWFCGCGIEGDSSTIRYIETESGKIMLVCPVCGRRPRFLGGQANLRYIPEKISSRKATRLRRQGLSYRKIGKILGCSHEGARRAVKRGEKND
jgi:transposase-like protein